MLRHFVIRAHFEFILAKGAFSFLNLRLFFLVVTLVHHNFRLQLLDLLLALFSLDLSLLASFLSVSLVLSGLLLPGSTPTHSNLVCLVSSSLLVALILVSSTLRIGLLLSQLIFFFGSNLAFQNLFELSDVIREEITHFRYSESGHKSVSSKSFYRGGVNVENIVEFTLKFGQFDVVLFNFPLLFALGLLNHVLASLD